MTELHQGEMHSARQQAQTTEVRPVEDERTEENIGLVLGCLSGLEQEQNFQVKNHQEEPAESLLEQLVAVVN